MAEPHKIADFPKAMVLRQLQDVHNKVVLTVAHTMIFVGRSIQATAAAVSETYRELGICSAPAEGRDRPLGLVAPESFPFGRRLDALYITNQSHGQ